ncbi:hypothetical protein KKP04_13745 [Rhodomicrobium sp. Az07]|uniref:hypothetical protein n=1 Tax=Rhodomicrobium sp. Az07 TaxID=2839034 RepID=UPI001BEC8A1E|nr:hypothetical protein [Rhodomicrobium sp. Az07]MBT3071925.1 hypothetical protein [Rhodomicrobium sp. Az07]
MASLSPNTIAINTIAHNLANAADAVAALDAAISEELRALIRLANAEVVRVRKAARKAAAAAKRAAVAAATAVESKQPARRGRKPKAKIEASAAVEIPAVVEAVAAKAIEAPAVAEAVAAEVTKGPAVVEPAPEMIEAPVNEATVLSGEAIEIPADALEFSAVLAAATPKARGRRRKTVANGMTAH